MSLARQPTAVSTVNSRKDRSSGANSSGKNSRGEKPRGEKSRGEEVAVILRNEILSGQYRAGERLPSERDLVTRFSTSRGVVREAFKMLEQLGVVSIQPGGARAVAVEECTLDVLGPLLDLEAIPNPKLVDQVLQIMGVLMGVAARAAVEKASDAELAQAIEHAENVMAYADDKARLQQAFQNFIRCLINVADHLVLRLIINGLRMTFMNRMLESGIYPDVDPKPIKRIATELVRTLKRRDAEGVGAAMLKLNKLFRDQTTTALQAAALRQEK